MLCPNCKEEIVSRQELIKLSRNFLGSVAENIQALIGSHPKRLQQSTWIPNTASKEMQSQNFQREIFDSEKVLSLYASQIAGKDFPEKAQLRDVLEEFDKFYQAIMLSDISSQLIRNWLKLPNPFSFEGPRISSLLNDFADTVIDNKIIFKSLIIIDGLNAANLPINFENDVTIRQITNDELWNFGEITGLQFSLPSSSMFSLRPMFDRLPKETWKILDIELRHDVPMGYSMSKEIGAIRDAVIMSLRLESSGSFRTIDMGYWANYIHDGLIRNLDHTHLSIGRCGGNYTLDAGMIKRIRDSWPTIRMIMESDSHYLRLPAQRLFEGSERKKQEDAILDYAIGLERLLLARVEGELSYRFALRGATILAWENVNKRTFFKNLRDFYNLRSYIAHGSRRAPPVLCLSDACSYGEDYLRKIWWWYVINGFTDASNGLNRGTEKIDSRILGDEVILDQGI